MVNILGYVRTKHLEEPWKKPEIIKECWTFFKSGLNATILFTLLILSLIISALTEVSQQGHLHVFFTICHKSYFCTRKRWGKKLKGEKDDADGLAACSFKISETFTEHAVATAPNLLAPFAHPFCSACYQTQRNKRMMFLVCVCVLKTRKKKSVRIPDLAYKNLDNH